MDLRKRIAVLLLHVLLFSNMGFSQIQYLQNIPPTASIRAIKLFQNTLYFAGNKGLVGKSTDLKTVTWKALKGFEKTEFRSIHVNNTDEILIATAGTPALILKTKDFFETIDTVYTDTSKNAFLDAMYFLNAKDGFVVGDPKNGLMTWLVTQDGGKTWKDNTQNAQLKITDGEAAFAASNTNISGYKNQLWLATGGVKSSVFYSKNKGKTWEKFSTPIWQGNQSTGIFSIHFFNKNQGVAVGGDYIQPNATKNNAIFTTDAGKTWKLAPHQVSGYRSGIGTLQNVLLCTGTNGTDISIDKGKNWKKLLPEGFNAITFASNSEVVILAGDHGKIGILHRNDIIKNHSK